MDKKPRVGVAALIIKDGKILFGKRIGSHGASTWAIPGGHLDFNETFEDCAKREVMEETSLSLTNIRYVTITNDFFLQEDKHYITIFMLADYKSGEVKILEPEKCEAWEWFSWDNLPYPLFLPIQNLLKQGFDPSST